MMTFGRLLLAGLLVAPLVSCGGTFVALAADAAGSQSASADNFLFGLILLSIVAFVMVAPAILLVGIPLALILERMRVPPLLRDAVFVGLGLAAALLARLRTNYDPLWAPFELGIIGATVLAWIIAMRLASRGRRPVEQVNG